MQIFKKIVVCILEFIEHSMISSQNTKMSNITGHPSLTVNVGMVLPEDVSKSYTVLELERCIL